MQVAQPPEAAKGLAKTRGVIHGTMAGIMETNATSGAKHAVLLLKEYRSFRVSSHCLTDSAKRKVGGDGPRSCCSRISRLKFRRRVRSAGIFLALLLYGSRDYRVTQEAHLKENHPMRHVHVLNVAVIKTIRIETRIK